jgi:predicted Zn-dependent peptidase
MRPVSLACACLIAMALGGGCRRPAASRPQPTVLTLDNGIRVVVVPIPGSKSVSIFTYLPMGLASDDDGHTQWSHLVEHLVIRSTIPAESREANAETIADHMRLDFYGTTGNWQEGLSHHAKWLQGMPFTEQSLAAEKPHVKAECDVVARNVATHKFACAAWAQGYRFGRTHAALKADVDRATLAEVQRYRDERMVVLPRTVVCVVGGVDAETVRPVVAERLGKIRSDAKPPPAVAAPGGSRDMTWDLDARHVIVTWPMPDIADPDYSALMVAGNLLTMRLASDAQLKPLTGMALAGTDLVTPEGGFFYASASVRPGSALEAVRGRLDANVEALRSDAQSIAQAPLFGRQLSDALTVVPDPAMLKAQTPPGMDPAMVEGNLGLQFGMQEYRYGPDRPSLAQVLSTVTADQVQAAARKWLAPEKEAVCTLRPKSDA